MEAFSSGRITFREPIFSHSYLAHFVHLIVVVFTRSCRLRARAFMAEPEGIVLRYWFVQSLLPAVPYIWMILADLSRRATLCAYTSYGVEVQ